MTENHLATAADFRRAAEAEAFGEPERVALPKRGLAVMIRRPRAAWFALQGVGLPAERVVRVEQRQKVEELKVQELKAQPDSTRISSTVDSSTQLEDKVRFANFWAETFKRMFVAPKLSLNPGRDEIHPSWIPDEDQEFLFGWALGVVGSDGTGLESFRGRFRGTTKPGPDRQGMELPPERSSVVTDAGVSS
jgi:hypothetical protein